MKMKIVHTTNITQAARFSVAFEALETRFQQTATTNFRSRQIFPRVPWMWLTQPDPEITCPLHAESAACWSYVAPLNFSDLILEINGHRRLTWTMNSGQTNLHTSLHSTEYFFGDQNVRSKLNNRPTEACKRSRGFNVEAFLQKNSSKNCQIT